MNQQPFYYVHGICGLEILEKHRGENFVLFHDVWALSWEDLKAQLESFRLSLLAGTGLPHSMVALY